MLCVTVILLAAFVGIMNWRLPPEEEGEFSLGDVRSLIEASPGDVYLMIPKSSSPTEQGLYDIFMNVCRNTPQIKCYYELGGLYVDREGRPRPNVIIRGKYLVFLGGPSSQACVRYYEKTSQTPVSLCLNSTHLWWETKDGSVVEGSVFAYEEINEQHDVFVMEFFRDEYGRKVFICYGYGWKGTWIAVEYFLKKISHYLEYCEDPFYLFDWTDRNGDGTPQVSEVSALDPQNRPKYACVQAVLKASANETLVKWFAESCHSRGIKVTWYVGIYAMREPLISLLKSYISLGDSVELSFDYSYGNIAFFNTMNPGQRLSYVDNCMGAFKHFFGSYPSMVEAYYIDAYTLAYISKKYRSVKGAVAYCNHEVFLDDFKSAGAYYMPYYPSKFNTLCPGTTEDKIDLVVMPFIHRDVGNCVIKKSALYSLNPQDGMKIKTAGEWRKYFPKLFDAFIDGWDKFGLALYLIDLNFPVLPRSIIEEDLDYIAAQINLGRCVNLVDVEFVEWFRSRFHESPTYSWAYRDPEDEEATFQWFFSKNSVEGYRNGELIELRIYDRGVYERSFQRAVAPYDNSAFPAFSVKP